MRYDGDHKAQSHARIVKAAARELRSKGPEKLAVADVMASAGLTHGGFYAHFASKEAMVAEAVDAMFAEGRRRLPAIATSVGDEDPKTALRAYLAAYLSTDHRDRPDRGCPLPALSADMARSSGTARSRFNQGLERLIALNESALTRIGIADPAQGARAMVAQMVGAIVLARAVGSGPQSDAILNDAQSALCERFGL